MTTCSFLRAMLKLSISLVCKPLPLYMLRNVAGTKGGSESGTRDDRWCSSMELSHSASLVIRVKFSSFASFSSLGRMIWLREY